MKAPGWFRWAAGATVLVAGACIAGLSVASYRWGQTTRDLVDGLQSRGTSVAGRVDFAALDAANLPAPVLRYFHAVLRDGQPLIASARLTHTGTFFVNDAWIPFESEQTFTSTPPGFVWNARMSMAPFVKVYVRDSYVSGVAAMLAKAGGIITVADQYDRPELNSGALHRYLAEAMWFPTALLPSDRLTWTAIDDTHATTRLTDGRTTVSLEFEFGPSGDIAGVFTPVRLREQNGSYEPAPWGATCHSYARHSGMRIPVDCEVYWKIGGEQRPYWRGEIKSVDYTFDASLSD